MNDFINHQETPEKTCFSASDPHSRSLRTKCLGVSVIRREFVDLTGDHFSAVVLNQLLYWTQRVKDFDLLLEEERTFHPECNVLPRHGWIYKTSDELIEETMLKASAPTMRKYLKHLIDRGWLDERPHPSYRWKKTIQYRVNLRKLHTDLHKIGHRIPEVYRDVFVSSLEEGNQSSFNREYASSEEILSSNQNASEDPLCSEERNLPTEERNFSSSQKIFPSKEKNLASYTYTEITSKKKNKEHTEDLRAQDFFDDNFLKQTLGAWKSHIGQDVHLTDERTLKLKPLLAQHFQNDLSQWEFFCARVKSSSFLMGEGSRKWRVTFDWILEESNLLKILEGNFDSPENLQQIKDEKLSLDREKERSQILSSIEDPDWQYWCTQASRSDVHDYISLSELKGIAAAKFAEFDGRLVWIESENPATLNNIENLRLKLLSIVGRTYPKARNIRTRLQESAHAFFPIASQLLTQNQKGNHHAE